eukprot:scaffold81106_cov31-Tisochrysis_lutea.AAC.6
MTALTEAQETREGGAHPPPQSTLAHANLLRCRFARMGRVQRRIWPSLRRRQRRGSRRRQAGQAHRPGAARLAQLPAAPGQDGLDGTAF